MKAINWKRFGGTVGAVLLFNVFQSLSAGLDGVTVIELPKLKVIFATALVSALSASGDAVLSFFIRPEGKPSARNRKPAEAEEA